MRAKIAVGWFLLPLLAFGAPGRSQPAAEPQALAAFAQQSGLHDVAGFVDAVQSLRATRHLPQRYVTKREAAAHGWHGGGLCTIWPGHVIGGDPFDNAAGALPGPARSYHEADLDESCARRGPKRLIYSEDGAIYITVDHYSTIVVVP
jgi:hypothetical protein